jgi:hypothetical protein
MIVELEIETPVILVETETPDLVQILADATIEVIVSPGTGAIPIPINDLLTGDGASQYTLINVPYPKSELIMVGGSLQMRGINYNIVNDQLIFIGDSPEVPVGIPILVYGWKI